eukprot:8468072-Alexandrium_andersonii.AAC.1
MGGPRQGRLRPLGVCARSPLAKEHVLRACCFCAPVAGPAGGRAAGRRGAGGQHAGQAGRARANKYQDV